MNPLVSVVITTHNRKILLINAIKSVFAQTYKELEVVLVDDASNDGTQEELLRSPFHERVKYIFLKESKGGNHARNIGIRQTHGKYIALLDDDDEWMPNKIEKQVLFLENHSDYGLVSCSRTMEFNYSERKNIDVSIFPHDGDMKAAIWYTNSLVTSTLMFRRNILFSVGMFDEQLTAWQDYELLLRTAQYTNIGIIREPLVLYRSLSTDKKRITNNIHKWENSIKYINAKHRKFFDSQSNETKKKYYKMVAVDGLHRSYTNRDRSKRIYYLWKLFICNPSLKGLFRIFVRGFI